MSVLRPALNALIVRGHAARATSLRAAVAAASLALLAVSHSGAAATQATAEQRQACTPDVFRLCSSEIPNVTRIVACMEKKRSELSPACRAVFNPPAKTATRSMIATTPSDWCAFGRGEDPRTQEFWKTWCMNR